MAQRKRTSFKKGHAKKGGREAGVVNKITREVKEAALIAAENVGFDRKGRDGLVGYMMRLAVRNPATFGGILTRLIPLQLHANVDHFSHIETREQLIEEYRRLGIPYRPIIEDAPVPVLDLADFTPTSPTSTKEH